MNRPLCQGITSNGESCRGFDLGNGYCISHDPGRASMLAEARARGGAKASQLRRLQGELLRLETPAAIVRYCGRLAQRVVNGEVDHDVGRSAAAILSVTLKGIEAADLARRLRKLEQQAEQRRLRAVR